MKQLNQTEIESVSGGFVFLLGLAEAGAIASSIFGAYQAGKVLGSDYISYLSNS